MRLPLALAIVTAGGIAVTPSQAAIIGFSAETSSAGTAAEIIAPPTSLDNDAPFNTGQQGFDELQGVLLADPLAIDGGSLAAGTVVDSHMIFMNEEDGTPGTLSHTVTWIFDGMVVGVMSDVNGRRETASNSVLGLPTTSYPGSFQYRGLESHDGYVISGNQITIDLSVAQPGDWIRVVTAPATTHMPEPGTLLLLGVGLSTLALRLRHR